MYQVGLSVVTNIGLSRWGKLAWGVTRLVLGQRPYGISCAFFLILLRT